MTAEQIIRYVGQFLLNMRDFGKLTTEALLKLNRGTADWLQIHSACLSVKQYNN